MAIMSDSNRAAVSADLQSDLSAARAVVAGCLKTDIRAAVNAVDQWVSDNSVSFNNALPAVAKNNLTAAQKAQLLLYVVRKRYLAGT